MTVSLRDGMIVLSGACGVAEAETLLSLLVEHPEASVEVSSAEAIHTALWQVMMACRVKMVGVPEDSFATKWLVPSICALGISGEGSDSSDDEGLR